MGKRVAADSESGEKGVRGWRQARHAEGCLLIVTMATCPSSGTGDVAHMPGHRLPNKCNSLSRSAGGPLDSNLPPHAAFAPPCPTLLMPKGSRDKSAADFAAYFCMLSVAAFWNPQPRAINIALSSLTSKAEFPLLLELRLLALHAGNAHQLVGFPNIFPCLQLSRAEWALEIADWANWTENQRIFAIFSRK